MTDREARLVPRTQPLLVLLAICGCLLVALLGLEYHSAVKRELRLASSSSLVAPGGAPVGLPAAGPAVPSPLQPGADRVGEWTRTALARPLFSASRRPAAVAVSGPQEPRLAGIVLSPSGNTAIFAGDNDARGTVAGVGQQAGSWHVLAIAADGVRVVGPNGLRTLRPSRDPSGHGDDAASGAGAQALPPHPSILDLLRARVPQNGLTGAMPPLPAILRGPSQDARQ